MKLYQKRHFYYIIFEKSITKGRTKEIITSKGSMEIELRQKITSIAHCEQIADYIKNSLATKTKNNHKTNPVPEVLVINFTLLRIEYRFWVKN